MLWWEESLKTGFERIDKQHKEIFARAEEMMSVDENTSATRIREMLNFLIDYVLTHFSEEERQMQQSGYPGFEKHKEHHALFVKKLYAVINLINKTGAKENSLLEFKLLIVEWLAAHINECDRKFVDFCNKK